jgi:hypothetical protein
MSKYNNSKVETPSGERFDSVKEYHRWRQLLLLQHAGIISDLQRQVAFELIPTQWETYERYGKNGQRLKDGRRRVELAVTYVADFVYTDLATGQTVVEDTKGLKKGAAYYLFVLKRKLFLDRYGIKIKET